MDPSLSYGCHIDQIIQKCIGILIGILNAKHAIPPAVLPKVIDALVFSHVRYCVQVYGSANRTNISKLQKVFNFAARVISGRRKYDHISHILNQLGWLSAHQFVSYFDLCLMHSILTTEKPQVLRSSLMFNRERVGRDTRQSDQLAIPFARNNHGKRRYMYRAVKLYNEKSISKGLTKLSRQSFKEKVRDAIRQT